MNIFFKSIFLLSILLTLQAKSQNLLINGDFEQGQGGVGVVPDFWELVSGTPDHCESPPTNCNLPPVVSSPSPQGGKWVRFFYASTNQGINNEIFGQQLQTPLVQGQEYRITLYIAHTSINPIFPATPTSSIRIGFSNGNPTNQVGQFDRQDLVTDAIDTWVQRSYTFVASGNFNFISIGKTAQEMQNACYADDIVLEPVCAVSLGSNLTLCDGEEFTLDATRPNGTYLWHDGSTNPTFTGNIAGTYYVEVITPECTSSDTITVTYLPIINFSINFGNDTTLCEGESLNLALNVPNATYLWQNNSTNNNFNVTTSGQYYVTATVNQCSIQSDTINVSFISPTSVNLGNDTTLCEGETLVLSVNTPGATYIWQDNSTNPTFTVSSAGTYSVEVTIGNCSASDEISIAYNPLPVISLGDDLILCEGDTAILNASLEGATYEWQDASTDSLFTVTESGDYRVLVTASNGCSNEFSIKAQFNAPPELDLGEDSVSTCKSSPIILDAFTPNATYLWQDESTDSEFEPTVTGDYYVQVTVGPCVVSDTVHVTLIDCAIIIEMPNVFTPNGDAINDVFIPKSYEGISSARMIILNRWGRTIFETENIEEGWSGDSANDKSPDGVYFYIVSYTDIENKQGELKGTVTLIRN
jgi:gliding motility-associated-like protein